MPTKQDNEETNYIGTVYVKSDTELSWSTGSSLVCDEKKEDKDVIDCTSTVDIENDTELSWPLISSVDCIEN